MTDQELAGKLGFMLYGAFKIEIGDSGAWDRTVGFVVVGLTKDFK